MTTGERKALAFLAAVGVLGAGARLVTAPARAPSREERAALRGQIDAVDSARGAERGPHVRHATGGPGAHVARARRLAAVWRARHG